MKVRTVAYNQKHQSYNSSANLNKQKMRKYYQAALALTAAVSLVALLFYRHEYNKLRFVLQVFNYFGTPQKNLPNCTNNFQITNNNFQAAPTSWQRISSDLYVYSAYSFDEGEIKAIGFGKHSGENYYCRVFFDDQLESVEGKFQVQKIDENRQDLNNDDLINNFDEQEYSGYSFSCKFDKLHDKDIVGMQIIDEKLKNSENIPIIQVQTLYNNFSSNKTGTIICVAPPISKPLKNIDMISFLAFHDYVGWDNFIVYDYGIPHVFNEAVKKMSMVSNLQWNFTYSTIPWNFPYPQVPRRVVKNLIEADCLYRTFLRASFAITLAWDEYVNLKYHTSVEHVLSDLNKVNGKIDDKFRLNAVVFCTDFADSDSVNSPTPVILRTTRRLRNVDRDEPLFIYKRDHISNYVTQQEMDQLMIVNRYKQCNTNDRRQIVNGVLRFAESMPSTQIFQYYITGKLFGHN